MVTLKTQQSLNEKLNRTQERISKLIDMHIDGKIDAETYSFKLEEYKREQQSITLELKSYSTGSKDDAFTAKEALNLAKEAKQIFVSSKLDEKQQLLRFFFSNFKVIDGNLDPELRECTFIFEKSPQSSFCKFVTRTNFQISFKF